jgi:guanosine-3',5'-bis(diphosphate) 3'-pyrophosphohydrolase
VTRAQETRKKTAASSNYGIKVGGVEDVMLRLARCCRPVPGDPIVGYISPGKGITIHHDHCPNAEELKRNPERFTPAEWEGDTSAPVAHVRRDRHHILEARCTVVHPMVKDRFVVEVGDNAGAEDLRSPPAQHRVGLRCVSRDADGLSAPSRCPQFPAFSPGIL